MHAIAPLSVLSPGSILACPIHDAQNTLLLGAGVTVTQEFLTKLYRRGVRTVTVDKRDLVRLIGFSSKGTARNALPGHNAARSNWNLEATKELDAAVDAQPNCDVVPADDPFSQQFQTRGVTRYDDQQIARLVDQREKMVDQVGNLMQQLADGKSVAADAVQSLSRDFLIRAAEDIDLFTCMGINPSGGDSVFEHSANVAQLAIAVGATLGLDRESLTDLGTGCLVHDAGMLHIKQDVLRSSQVLDEVQFAEKAPVLS